MESVLEKRRDKIWVYIKSLFKDRKRLYYIITILAFISGLVLFGIGQKGVLAYGLVLIPIISFVLIKQEKYWTAFMPFILLFGVFIRVQNWALLKGKIPLELDPFVFLRYTQYIVEHGTLYATDIMRYVPVGFNTARELPGVPYTIAYMHKTLVLLIPKLTLETTFLIYPVIFFALSIIVFYFLTKELTNEKTAFIATFFLSVIPTFLQRTMAGFSDKEALALFLMFSALYFFVIALKQKNLILEITYGLLAGIATALMALTWGGVRFLILTIAFYFLLIALLDQIDRKKIIVYTTWLIPIFFVLALTSAKYGGIKGFITSIDTGPSVLILILALMFFVGKKYLPKKIPYQLTILLFLIIIAGIGTVIIGMDRVAPKIIEIKEQMINPFGSERLSLTVAENKQPYFLDWWYNYGVFLLLTLAGIILYFYNTIKPLKKYGLMLTITLGEFVLGMLFSRYSQYSVFDGINNISQLMFFGTAAIFFFFIIILITILHIKEPELEKSLVTIKTTNLLLIAWFIITVFATRGAYRLFHMFSPVAAIVAAIAIVEGLCYIPKIQDKIYRGTAYSALIILALTPAIMFTTESYNQAKYSSPPFNNQWQQSMGWAQKNTPEDAVFAHWWDYGYWVQTGGERATILDGGNFIPYWNHLMARHVLCADNYDEALQFLYTHNATHLLIISDEIGKYTAYSSIGSDQEFDIFSWMDTFWLDPYETHIKGNTSTYLFRGSTMLDQNLTYNGTTFEIGKAVIAAFYIPVMNDNLSEEETAEPKLLQPKAIIIQGNEQYTVPVECVYDDEQWIRFEAKGLGGCLRIIPKYLNSEYQQENGALIYVSEKGIKTLWARLFLFDEENEYFKLIYDDSQYYHLASYRNQIIGPLKIWEIKYPEGYTVNETLKREYTAISTPQWEELTKKSALAQQRDS